MKTYTTEEFKDYFGITADEPTIRNKMWLYRFDERASYPDEWGEGLTCCSCVYYFLLDCKPNLPLAYENCTNCGGKGSAPISWSELK